jgi:hypothetical protein
LENKTSHNHSDEFDTSTWNRRKKEKRKKEEK